MARKAKPTITPNEDMGSVIGAACDLCETLNQAAQDARLEGEPEALHLLATQLITLARDAAHAALVANRTGNFARQRELLEARLKDRGEQP